MQIKYKLYSILTLLILIANQQLWAQSKLRLKIPFEMKNGSIILSVKINQSQKPLKLLFDTGADGMALSEALADSLGLKISRKQSTSVVGGNMEISISTGNDVHLDSFVLKNQSIAIFKKLDQETDGIIGNSMTSSFITKIDFDNKILSLYDFDGYQYEKGGTAVPVNFSGVYSIPGSVNISAEKTNEGHFIFDTGASYYLICFRPFVKQNRLLVNGFKPEYQGSTTSMGISTPTFSGQAASFSFNAMPKIKAMPITLMAGGGQSESWTPGFDGSIGMRLISRYNFTINRKKNEIHLMPNSSFKNPLDFTLNNYLLGFNETGKLVVQGIIRVLTETLPIKKGDEIEKINGISSQEILKEPLKRDKIIRLPAGSNFNIEYNQDGKKQIILKKA
ncbi:retropepsin-like aspartic protease [Pedobacter punctiformis]|uniref:Retropepsin-like aspartic protease n=1 Tax=Pedobacter punctiformis TaxID=3004097 RepID=A0ABT4L8R3_9SPHI|nr:retropepsin-like aspartic protease [Pedobacter sp. HCMS5-2]MCZ4243179.1 retropepsin-like aspartic protease [Pedobacter sp. HCMS5-2]